MAYRQSSSSPSAPLASWLRGALQSALLVLAACQGRLPCDGDARVCLGEVTCGDGFVDGAEECDDGNVFDGDYCTSGCLRNGRCGDGVLQPVEACDDRNTLDGDYCSSLCDSVTGACGDGVLSRNEECDDGNAVAADYCTRDCRENGRCGDAVLQSHEECDDGNTGDGDYCSMSCDSILGWCGDGVVQTNEICDSTSSLALCTEECRSLAPSCDVVGLGGTASLMFAYGGAIPRSAALCGGWVAARLVTEDGDIVVLLVNVLSGEIGPSLPVDGTSYRIVSHPKAGIVVVLAFEDVYRIDLRNQVVQHVASVSTGGVAVVLDTGDIYTNDQSGLGVLISRFGQIVETGDTGLPLGGGSGGTVLTAIRTGGDVSGVRRYRVEDGQGLVLEEETNGCIPIVRGVVSSQPVYPVSWDGSLIVCEGAASTLEVIDAFALNAGPVATVVHGFSSAQAVFDSDGETLYVTDRARTEVFDLVSETRTQVISHGDLLAAIGVERSANTSDPPIFSLPGVPGVLVVSLVSGDAILIATPTGI